MVGRRPIADVLQLPPEVVEAFDARTCGRSAARRLEFKFRTTDGARDRHRSERDASGNARRHAPGLLITFQDLTDVKKLEHDAQLQQRLAAVGEMAAGIAHEIRNPLASMSGSIQILRQELPLSAEQEQLMDIVMRESERLNTTIRSFLAYARPQRFAIARFDLRRALQRHGTAAAQQRRRARAAHDRGRRAAGAESGTRPTRGRSSRSSGTSPPMACARCPMAAACELSARSAIRTAS